MPELDPEVEYEDEEEEEEEEVEDEQAATPPPDPVPVKIRRRDDVWPPKVTETPKVEILPGKIKRRDDMWPPKTSSVKFLPRTGFSPTVAREGGEGKKFIWPPPKESTSPHLNDVGELPRVQSRRLWNPDEHSGSRPPPFAPATPPARRCTDEIWPPKGSGYQPLRMPSPRPVKTIGRFEDYIKWRSGPNVPATYRTPPGTQHIQVEELQGEFIHQSKTTTTTVTSSTAVKTEQARRVEVQEEEESEEE